MPQFLGLRKSLGLFFRECHDFWAHFLLELKSIDLILSEPRPQKTSKKLLAIWKVGFKESLWFSLSPLLVTIPRFESSSTKKISKSRKNDVCTATNACFPFLVLDALNFLLLVLFYIWNLAIFLSVHDLALWGPFFETHLFNERSLSLPPKSRDCWRI